MIEAAGVTKKYGKLTANDNISMTAYPGRITVLLGPNGAGKSTLIKSIVGLLRFEGKILINGVENKSIEAKKQLGYVPEMPAVYDLLTVYEHLEFIARAYELDGSWKEDAQTLLERFELSDKRDKLAKELSNGMQQNLSIACALIIKPKAVVLDEPLVGLDPHAIKELKLMMKELADSGAAVLVSTHMIDSMEDNWDSAYIMVKGKIAASVEREDDGHDLEKLFFDITEGAVG